MTREEFKNLVRKNQRREKLSGYILFLFPFGASLWLLIDVIADYIRKPDSLFMIEFALVISLLCAGLAWWACE